MDYELPLIFNVCFVIVSIAFAQRSPPSSKHDNARLKHCCNPSCYVDVNAAELCVLLFDLITYGNDTRAYKSIVRCSPAGHVSVAPTQETARGRRQSQAHLATEAQRLDQRPGHCSGAGCEGRGDARRGTETSPTRTNSKPSTRTHRDPTANST